EDTIAVQEDIAEKIAEAMNVVLDDEKREAMRQAGLRDVEAFIALQKGIQLYETAHGAPDMLAKLREANDYFEVVQQRVPDYAPAYLLHSDQYIHLLMSDATGQSLEGALAEDVAAAMGRAVQDTAAGVAKSKNEDARSNAELDLAFISSDWQGMPARIERFLAQSGCEEITWVSNIGSLTGYAQRLIPRDEEYLSCDPLSSSSWRFLVRDNLWAGNPAGALEVARQGEQRAPGSWLGLQMVSALVALGDFDAADQVATATFHNDEDIAITHMMVAAARGDRETAERMLEEFLAGPLPDHYWGLIFSAWAGNRELANSSAATIDRHVFGSPALITIALWCTCGEPWDLQVTPKFAADIAESGLAWPPISPIRFPLKDQVAEIRTSNSGTN
ncbi:MAG: hypothetical protein ACREVW_11890, partial [Burkholderiales bacterium]